MNEKLRNTLQNDLTECERNMATLTTDLNRITREANMTKHHITEWYDAHAWLARQLAGMEMVEVAEQTEPVGPDVCLAEEPEPVEPKQDKPKQGKPTVQKRKINPNTVMLLRDDARLSRAALADIVNISSRYVYDIETGNSNPRQPIAERIADALGVPADVLYKPYGTACGVPRDIDDAVDYITM